MRRLMFEGAPFHVTHRGNHKQDVFDDDADRRRYLDLLRTYAARFAMGLWGYCLMNNHVHLIVVGERRTSIPRAVGNAHRAYSRRRNLAREVTGHLWANRFFSTLLDETHLWAAIRYVELNPVRARLVSQATDFEWSSARFHAGLVPESRLLDPARPFPGPIGDWPRWLAAGIEDETVRRLRENTAKGEPTGNEDFVAAVERRVGRRLRLRRGELAGVP